MAKKSAKELQAERVAKAALRWQGISRVTRAVFMFALFATTVFLVGGSMPFVLTPKYKVADVTPSVGTEWEQPEIYVTEGYKAERAKRAALKAELARVQQVNALRERVRLPSLPRDEVTKEEVESRHFAEAQAQERQKAAAKNKAKKLAKAKKLDKSPAQLRQTASAGAPVPAGQVAQTPAAQADLETLKALTQAFKELNLGQTSVKSYNEDAPANN